MDSKSFGPIPPERFKEIVAMPFGKARDAIREYDPLWGILPGETIEWKVTFERSGHDTGYAIVEAATEQDAEDIADKLNDAEIDWDCNDGDISITKIEPHKRKT